MPPRPAGRRVLALGGTPHTSRRGGSSVPPTRSRAEVAGNRFREDLFYPAQRHQHHGGRRCASAGRRSPRSSTLRAPLLAVCSTSRRARSRPGDGGFMQYNWPGNIRELENSFKRMSVPYKISRCRARSWHTGAGRQPLPAAASRALRGHKGRPSGNFRAAPSRGPSARGSAVRSSSAGGTREDRQDAEDRYRAAALQDQGTWG